MERALAVVLRVIESIHSFMSYYQKASHYKATVFVFKAKFRNIRWIPHTIRDNKDSIRVLFFPILPLLQGGGPPNLYNVCCRP